MIAGLGVDIVEIDRMRGALERHPALRARLFSEGERAYCEKRNRPEIHYALRFAAKEAVLKALGSGFRGMRFTDVEVFRDGSGRPEAVLHGAAAQRAAEMGVAELHLSLSYTHNTAVASAVALLAPPTVDEPEPEDTERARADRTFKGMRSFLDTLEG